MSALGGGEERPEEAQGSGEHDSDTLRHAGNFLCLKGWRLLAATPGGLNRRGVTVFSVVDEARADHFRWPGNVLGKTWTRKMRAPFVSVRVSPKMRLVVFVDRWSGAEIPLSHEVLTAWMTMSTARADCTTGQEICSPSPRHHRKQPPSTVTTTGRRVPAMKAYSSAPTPASGVSPPRSGGSPASRAAPPAHRRPQGIALPLLHNRERPPLFWSWIEGGIPHVPNP